MVHDGQAAPRTSGPDVIEYAMEEAAVEPQKYVGNDTSSGSAPESMTGWPRKVSRNRA